MQQVSGGDALTVTDISTFLKAKDVFIIEVRDSVTSTNTVLRSLAAMGAPEGYVLAAAGQTAGKGRHGRSFHSPADSGAYFSLLLRPGPKTCDASLITSAAAVAAAEAIEEVFGLYVGIKWVNDLVLETKKVCGILTEAEFNVESGMIDSAVLGIGINITKPENGFPEELRDVATALTGMGQGDLGQAVGCEQAAGGRQLNGFCDGVCDSGQVDGGGAPYYSAIADISRCRIIAATLDSFWGYYKNLSAREFLDEYRARSILLDRDIYVFSRDAKQPARALAIDDDCRLVVRYENGEVAALSSGEVSVRLGG